MSSKYSLASSFSTFYASLKLKLLQLKREDLATTKPGGWNAYLISLTVSSLLGLTKGDGRNNLWMGNKCKQVALRVPSSLGVCARGFLSWDTYHHRKQVRGNKSREQDWEDKFKVMCCLQVIGMKIECNDGEFEQDPEGQRLSGLINAHLPLEASSKFSDLEI